MSMATEQSGAASARRIGPGVRIADVVVGDRARKEFGDLTNLIESIREHGILQPIGLLPGDRLLFGGRRLEACKQLGWDSIPVVFPETQDDALSLLKAERDENTCRKEMTYSEKVAIADRIADMERPKAATRRAEGARLGGLIRQGSAFGPTGPKAEDEPYRRSTEVAAEAVGISRKTYERAKLVADTAENDRVSEDVREVARQARDDMDSGASSVRTAQHKVNEALGRSAESTASADKPGRQRAAPKRQSNARPSRKDKATLLAELAKQGFSSRQMRQRLDYSTVNQVRELAREYEIDIPADRVIGRSRVIDSNRIVNEIVSGLEGTRMSIELIDYADLDLELAAHWADSLKESIKALSDLRKAVSALESTDQGATQ